MILYPECATGVIIYAVIRSDMSQLSVKCPKCGNLCTFREGKVFGYCNKCGSNLERDVKNIAKVYDRSSETDENLLMAYDRTETCTSLKVPTRDNFDIEGYDFEVERIMDNLMVFNEVMEDIYNSLNSMDFERKIRVCELCSDMVDRVVKQFDAFVTEFEDYGMKEALTSTSAKYNRLSDELSAEFSRMQSKSMDELWKGREEERAQLVKELNEAKIRKKSIPMYDLRSNWEADNEIAELERKLNGME